MKLVVESGSGETIDRREATRGDARPSTHEVGRGPTLQPERDLRDNDVAAAQPLLTDSIYDLDYFVGLRAALRL